MLLIPENFIAYFICKKGKKLGLRGLSFVYLSVNVYAAFFAVLVCSCVIGKFSSPKRIFKTIRIKFNEYV